MWTFFLVATALAQSAPVERRLYADRVDASSFLWNDWNKFQENYHPNYVMDGDPTTAWVEGADDAGVGQWLRLPVTPLDGATKVRLRVRNGYQKSSTLYKANARAREVELTLLPSGVKKVVTLADAEGWQDVVIEQPSGKLESVLLTVKSVFPGGKYADLAISDVELYATATTRDNPAAEKGKLDRIVAWKASRVEAAKAFATATDVHLPLATAYTLEVVPDGPKPEVTGNCGADPFCEAKVAVDALAQWAKAGKLPANVAPAVERARAALAGGFAGWAPVQAVPTDKRRIPGAEGVGPANLYNCYYEPALYTQDGQASGAVELPVPGAVGFLRASTIGTFAVTNGPSLADAVSGNAKGCGVSDARPATFAWAQMGSPGDGPARVQALLVANCGEMEDREGMTRVTHNQLAVYDAAGNLTVLVGPRYATAFAWSDSATGPVLTEAWRVARWSDAVHAKAVQRVTKTP